MLEKQSERETPLGAHQRASLHCGDWVRVASQHSRSLEQYICFWAAIIHCTHHSAETLSGELLAASLSRSASLTQHTQGKGQPVKQCSQDEL